MKKFLITSILAAIVAIGTAAKAQDYPDEYLGLPGDNFNLYAVMNLFQQSETLEGFERSLNDENSRINNLDLNNDNYIDYVKVIDYVKGDVHTIVLQAVLDRDDSQDVAVFTVEKLRNGAVQIQLIGDEALYGRNYIIEPYYAETPNPGYTGRAKKQNVQSVRTTYVAIDAWPVVRYIYLPNYSIWHSSWYWGYYPSYWRPWSPYYYHYYYGYHYNWYPTYYAHYRVYHTPRWSGWNDYYYRDKRMYSRNVTEKINEGKYKSTYSRPESRREGEALYAKVNPDRASTMTQQGTSGTRRSASQAEQLRQNAGTSTSTSRRSGGTATETTRSTNQSGQSSGNARRSTTTGTQPATTGSQRTRSNSDPERERSTTGSGANSGTERRPAATANPGAGNGSSDGQSTSRRSSGTSVSKPATTSQAGPRVESARSSRQETSAPAASSRRSNDSKVSKETVVRQGSGGVAKARDDKKTETPSSRRK